MNDTNDPQDIAESLDPDVLADYDDSEGNLAYPPDEPWGVEQYGLTAAEERVDEPLHERTQREVADTLPDSLADDALGDVDRVRRLIAPGGDDPILADDEAEAVAIAVEGTDLSAEEEAIHIIREP